MEILKGTPNLFFTSDWHFDDKHLVTKGIRKFASMEEMNETMIARYNEVVRPGDLVYVLGDLFMGKEDSAEAIRKRLKGNLYVIQGNHDRVAEKLAKKYQFGWLRQLENISVGAPWFGEKKQPIVLCHYAMRTWSRSTHGSWQLYGHSHGNLEDIPSLLAFDVGVDVKEWNYYPVSIEQIIQKMNTKMPAFLEWKAGLKKSDSEAVLSGVENLKASTLAALDKLRTGDLDSNRRH